MRTLAARPTHELHAGDRTRSSCQERLQLLTNCRAIYRTTRSNHPWFIGAQRRGLADCPDRNPANSRTHPRARNNVYASSLAAASPSVRRHSQGHSLGVCAGRPSIMSMQWPEAPCPNPSCGCRYLCLPATPTGCWPGTRQGSRSCAHGDEISGAFGDRVCLGTDCGAHRLEPSAIELQCLQEQ